MFSFASKNCHILYKLLIELFSTFCGTVINLMLSLFAIIFGLFYIWSYNWITDQIIYQITINSSISWISERICLGMGIGMFIIGIAILSEILINTNGKRKFFLFISLIFSILIFASIIALGYLLFSDFSNSKLQEEYICNGSNLPIPVLMYNKIKDKSASYEACPSSCKNTTSKKLLECQSLQLYLNVNTSSYPPYFFDLISSLENKYQCAGICKTHDKIPCTFFDNFSNKNIKDCSEPVKENLQKYLVIIFCLFSGSLFGLLLNLIASTFTIIGIQKPKTQ